LAPLYLKILDATVGLRLKPEAEVQGMDIHEHGEEGYGRDLLVELASQESNLGHPFLSDDNLRVNSTSPEFKTVSTPKPFLLNLSHPDGGILLIYLRRQYKPPFDAITVI